MALVALKHVESSRAREPVSPALGGGFFNHWATREALRLFFEEFDYSVFGRSLTHSLKIEFLFSIFFLSLENIKTSADFLNHLKAFTFPLSLFCPLIKDSIIDLLSFTSRKLLLIQNYCH